MAHAGGRPTKYTPEIVPRLTIAMKNGLSVQRFCRDEHLSPDTFYRWVKEHSEFSDAFAIGKSECEAYWETWLVENITNKDVNTALVKLFMANRFGWSDKSESKHEHSLKQEDALKELK